MTCEFFLLESISISSEQPTLTCCPWSGGKVERECDLAPGPQQPIFINQASSHAKDSTFVCMGFYFFANKAKNHGIHVIMDYF